VASRHTEYYLHWCWNLLHTHGAVLLTVLNSMAHLESVRALIRAISTHEREIMRMSDENVFSLRFLTSQMVECSPEDFSQVALIEAEEEENESEQEVHEEVNFSINVTPSVVSPVAAPVATPVARTVAETEAMEVVAEEEVVPVSTKKSAKKSKKLTIQTSPVEKEPVQEASAPAQAVPEETIFETPNKAKKDKKSVKSATKSLLKSVSKYGHDEELMTSAERRVSFSKPLSMVKLISPIEKSKFLGIPAGANIEQDEENVRSASKKRLWADEDA